MLTRIHPDSVIPRSPNKKTHILPMYRYQIPRLPRPLLPIIPWYPRNQKLHTNLQLRTPTGGGISRTHLLQLLNEYFDRRPNTPRPDLCALLGPPNVEPQKPPSATHPVAISPQLLVTMAASSTSGAENDTYTNATNPLHSDTEDTYEALVALLLDAIAAVCVRKPKEEVFAVALQVDNAGDRIQLTIAGNDNVPVNSITHVKAIWKILQCISDHYAGYCHLEHKGEALDHGTDIPLLQKLQHTIYEFSSKKLVTVFDSHWLQFQKLSTAFKKIHPELDQACNTEERRTNEALARVTNTLESTLAPLFKKLKANDCLDNSEWKALCTGMDELLHDYQHIFSANELCEKWVARATGSDKQGKPTTYNLQHNSSDPSPSSQRFSTPEILAEAQFTLPSHPRTHPLFQIPSSSMPLHQRTIDLPHPSRAR